VPRRPPICTAVASGSLALGRRPAAGFASGQPAAARLCAAAASGYRLGMAGRENRVPDFDDCSPNLNPRCRDCVGRRLAGGFATAVTTADRQVEARVDGSVCHRRGRSRDSLLNFPNGRSSGRCSCATLSRPRHDARLSPRRPGVWVPVPCTTARALPSSARLLCAPSSLRDQGGAGARSGKTAPKQAGEPPATQGRRPCGGRALSSALAGQTCDALGQGQRQRRGA
jgi:hypothetical protein